MTDILLDEGPDQDWVTIDSPVLNTTAGVFMFGGNANPGFENTYRRALVYAGDTDALVINYGDYAGGVRLNNVTSFHNQPGLKLDGIGRIRGEGLALEGVGEIRGEDNTGPIVPEEIAFRQKILIRGEITIEKQGMPGVDLQGIDPTVEGGVTPSRYISLQQTLLGLQDQIDALTAQVAELQGKLGIG
jgi:hypothetical protein